MSTPVVEERYARRLDTSRGEIGYIVRNTDPADAAAARAAVEIEAPDTFGGLPLDDVEVDELEIDAAGVWTATARYQLPSGGGSSEVGDSRFSFEIGGSMQRITQSLQTVGAFAPSGAVAPDFKGAIGVTASGVEGTDIHVPTYAWSQVHTKSAAEVTDAYKATLINLVGTMNSQVFKNIQPGANLAVGVSGTQEPDDGPWQIKYDFACSPNATNIQIGDITIAEKYGWDYLWVLYEDEVDSTAERLVRRPVAAYIERVYRIADHNDFNI